MAEKMYQNFRSRVGGTRRNFISSVKEARSCAPTMQGLSRVAAYPARSCARNAAAFEMGMAAIVGQGYGCFVDAPRWQAE